MNTLTTFDFNETPVRVIDRDGEPWWIVADVCRVLDIQNPRDVITRLDEEDVNTVVLADGIRGRGNPNVNVVNEAGLYDLILRSDKPQARAFKRWITHEVLPAIRKTGSYSVAAEAEDEESPVQRALAALERAADAIDEAWGRVMDGTLSHAAAHVIIALSAEMRATWQLRFKLQQPELAPAGLFEALDQETGEALRAAVGRLERDAALKLSDIVPGLDRDRAKSAGRRLRGWRQHELTDTRGRRFRVGHRRDKYGVLYVITFMDGMDGMDAAQPSTLN